MARTRENDRRECEAFLRGIHEYDLMGPFVEYVLRTLPGIVAADQVTWNRVRPQQRWTEVISYPEQENHDWFADALAAHVHQHPLINHFIETREGSARKITDFLTPREFRATPLYNEFYRHLRYGDQFAIQLKPAGPQTTTLVVARAKASFVERDRELLDRLRPHIVLAMRQIELQSRVAQRLDRHRARPAWATIHLTPDGAITRYPKRAQRWIGWFWDRLPRVPGRLPAGLDEWFRHRFAALARGTIEITNNPLTVRRNGRVLSMFVRTERGNPLLLLLEHADPSARWVREQFTLTEREWQILMTLEYGKSNREIARDIGCTPATVKKHLENIYRKLGVENRTAAIARLRRAGRIDSGH